ncbi:MAG TPA: hypothetical protein VK427_13545 [Kofleriaceae bacterium]|nr:hypothetical protein [Kofleriaceae bacterium]
MQMLQIPRPRRYRPLWITATISAVLVGGSLALGGAAGAIGVAVGAVALVAALALMLGRVWTWAALAVGLGAGLGMVPLLGVLGFELAVVMSVFAAIMGADVGAAFARERQRVLAREVLVIERFGFPLRTMLRGTASAVGVALAIVALPASIAAVRGIWVPTCDWWFGIQCYLVMPVATCVLASATGFALGVLVGPRRFLGAFVAQLPGIIVALAATYRFYSEPPVFTYNAILGFFPGNLYDENVQLHWALVWSRLEQTAWVIALVALVGARLDVPTLRVRKTTRPASARPLGYVLAALGIAGGLVLHYFSGELGYAIDGEDIQAELGGRKETAHFVIYYARTKEITADIELIAADHELRYAQVVAQIGAAPARKLRSYYFASTRQKYRLFGAKDVEMAKPWLGDIYLDHRAFPHGSLRHEIAHAIAGEFGDPIFHVAARRVFGLPVLMSPALIEGTAVALDWPVTYDRPDPHESVRAMKNVPRLRQLFGLQFFAVSSARGYTTSGSFLRFLLERYGAAKLRAVYRNGGDFDAAYGVPRAKLEAEWKAMIEAIPMAETQIAAAAERFRGKSVFQRPCPHAIAKRREQAAEAYVAGNPKRAARLQRVVCADAPGEPRYYLELGDYLATGTVGERGEAVDLWSMIARDPDGVTSSLRAQAYERLARAAGRRGDLAAARALVAEGQALPIEPTDRRNLDALAFALDHEGPAGAALRDYFFGSVTPSSVDALLATIAEPDLGIAHYLFGLQAANKGAWRAAADALDRALARTLPTLAFTKNAARRLAVAAWRTGDRDRLSVAISVLSGSDMSSGDRALARDWLDRMTFASTGALHAAQK